MDIANIGPHQFPLRIHRWTWILQVVGGVLLRPGITALARANNCKGLLSVTVYYFLLE